MRRTVLLPVVFLSACSPVKSQIKHLSPLSDPTNPPKTCTLVGVLPGSPAQKSGLHVGDTLQRINDKQPTDALDVVELMDRSGPQARVDVLDSSGKAHTLTIALNKDKPRLGASCGLDGWAQKGVSSAGNESLTVYSGPYVLTVSGIFDKGLAFMRVRLSNHSDHDLYVSPELFSAAGSLNSQVTRLSPAEVLFFMHGEDALPYLKVPGESTTTLKIAADSPARHLNFQKKPKKEWSRTEEEYVQTNANYLSQESLWPQTVKPSQAAEGLIYFVEPPTQPFTVQAKVDTRILQVTFGDPQPAKEQMTQDQLIRFFGGIKKGTAVRLTLKTGKVFSGKYSSYDDLNETVWFDTPSGSLLTTSSFGLRSIAYAEALMPDRTQKPAAEPIAQ